MTIVQNYTESQFLFGRAEELYNNIVGDNNYESLPSPQYWLRNQDYFRQVWLNLKTFIRESSINFIFDQDIIKYMEYMYTAFPPGIGSRLLRNEIHKDDI